MEPGVGNHRRMQSKDWRASKSEPNVCRSTYFLTPTSLLYAVSNNPAEKQERQIARQLLENENWALSVQVLQEFYANATGKLAKTLPETETMQFISHLMQRPVVTTSPDLFLHAVALKNRYQLSYWDPALHDNG